MPDAGPFYSLAGVIYLIQGLYTQVSPTELQTDSTSIIVDVIITDIITSIDKIMKMVASLLVY